MSKPNYLVKFHGDLARYGCIACRIDRGRFDDDDSFGHAQVHHIREGGVTHESAVIPLCPNHHQYGSISVHGNKSGFRQKYGNEYELYMQIRSIFQELGKWPYQVENFLAHYVDGPYAPLVLVELYKKSER